MELSWLAKANYHPTSEIGEETMKQTADQYLNNIRVLSKKQCYGKAEVFPTQPSNSLILIRCGLGVLKI